MAGNNQGQTLRQTVDRILDIGQLSRLEYLQLVTTFLSDYKVTDEERNHINRIFDDIQAGHLKLFD
ncbi:MAG TPA: hypothetical protein V6D14_28630 [Coleofasciculaceae cyanobacterium]|jgi:hypothetical protein